MFQQVESRRSFIKKTAILAGVSIVPRFVLGGKGYVPPSDKINLGFIGTGRLSPYLSESFINLDTCQIISASDVYQAKLHKFKTAVESAYAEMKEVSNYEGCSTYEDYRELLDRSDIDAVIIATPDHWHAKISIDAMRRGKDVYCEKPMSHTIEEGRKMADVVKESGAILQVGSMQRSWKNFRYACELVYNGYLGEVRTIKVSVGDPSRPCDLPGEPQPEGLNWDVWLGAAKKRPFNAILAPVPEDTSWPLWRHFSEFGGGILADWGAHMFDVAQWAMGMDDSGPVELIPPDDPTARRGLKMTYKNGTEMYHEDFGRGFAVEFKGTEGILRISREFLESDPPEIVKTAIKNTDAKLYHSDNHYKNWIECIKSRKKPVCPVEVGHRSATVCHMANIAYHLNKPLKWDPVKEEFDNGKANKLRTKKYRKGYNLM